MYTKGTKFETRDMEKVQSGTFISESVVDRKRNLRLLDADTAEQLDQVSPSASRDSCQQEVGYTMSQTLMPLQKHVFRQNTTSTSTCCLDPNRKLTFGFLGYLFRSS